MATLHNKAGQYCKSEALRRFHRTINVLMATMVLLGALIAYMVLNLHSWRASLVGMVAVLVMVLFRRRYERYIESRAKEGMMYMRGGKTEAYVAWLLKGSLEGYYLFNNIELIPGSDLDHVLVGPGGVWCISTKSHRGLFTLEPDGRIFYNNEPTGLINDTVQRAMELRSRLDALMGKDVPFVEAVLAVPFAYVDFQNPQCNIWVLHQDNLVDTLESRPKKLSKGQIDRCIRALTDLANNASQTYKRPEPAYTTNSSSQP